MRSRNRFFFQTSEDGGGAAAAPASAEAAAAEGWQPSEEWGKRIDGFIEQSAPVLEQLAEVMSMPPEAFEQFQQPTQQPQQPVEDENFDLDAYIAQAVESRLGAFTPMLGQIAEREGEQIAREALGQLQGEIGSFDQDDAILLTRAYMDQGMQPQQALRQAATRAHEREEAIRTAAVEEYKTQFQSAAEAQPGVPVTGAAVQQPATPRGPGRYEEVLRNFESSLEPVSPSDL